MAPARGRVWEETAVATGDAGVAFRVAADSHVDDVPLGQHAAVARTVGEGLSAAGRAGSRYCTGQQFWITVVGDDVWVRRRFPDTLRRGRRQANDFALSMVIDLVRRGAGPSWKPTELAVEGSPPAHAEELAALATKSVRFGANADTLVFPRDLLELPLPPARPARQEPTPVSAADFARSVRGSNRALLLLGELTLASLAEVADTSVRSLQRRLAEEGLSFTRLAEAARFEAASRLLRDPGVRVIDVAAELGYTDSANFTRAFRRWAGVPPLAFRRLNGAR